MKKFAVSFIITTIMVLTSLFTGFNTFQANAALDPEARSHGFTVDMKEWGQSRWTQRRIPVYRDGKKVGEAVVNVGKSTCKKRTSDKKYIDTVMIDIKMRGFNYKKNCYGYASDILTRSKLPNGTKLLAASPVNSPSKKSTTYTVGFNLSKQDPSVSVSGSTTVNKKSMSITDKSNYGSNTYSTLFYYNRNINANYRYNTNTQLACFVTKTNSTRTTYNVDAYIGFAVGKKGLFGNSKKFADDIPTYGYSSCRIS